MHRDEFRAFQRIMQGRHDRANQQLVKRLLHVIRRGRPRVQSIAFQVQHMQLQVLLLINPDGAVQFNRQDAMDAARVDMQVQANVDPIVWRGCNLHIGQRVLLQPKLLHKDGGQRAIIQGQFHHARPGDGCRRRGCARAMRRAWSPRCCACIR